MPSRIEEFTAYRLLKLVERQLLTIRRANGYNCDPYVTLDFNDAVEAEDKNQHVLFLDTVSHPVEDTLPGPNYRPVLGMEIDGISNIDGEVPRVLSMELEQDVRTAVAGAVALVRDEISKGCVLRFGECPHYGVELSPKKQAGFTLAFTWMYPQGKVW